MTVTTRAIADNIVCGAEILMGETSQQIPIVIARGIQEVQFHSLDDVDEEAKNSLMKMTPHECLIMGPLFYNRKDEND